jgi:hypothetical protein
LDTKPLLLTVFASLLLASCNEPAVQLPAAGSTPATAMANSPEDAVLQAHQNEMLPLSDKQLLATLSPASESCNLEGIDYVPFGADPANLTRKSAVVDGWLFPKTVSTPEAQARLRFTDDRGTHAWETEITRWVKRDDVVASQGGDASDKPGFAQSVDFAALPPATYKVTVVFEDSTKSYICDNGRKLTLK